MCDDWWIYKMHGATIKIICLLLVNDQRDAQVLFYVFICIYNSLHVSSTSCSSSGETEYINTASGNSHSMLVTEMCAGWKKTRTCTHLGQQHRMTVTRGCIDTVCLSWWWARCARNMYRVINRNKYVEKNLCVTLVIYQQKTYNLYCCTVHPADSPIITQPTNALIVCHLF